VTDERSCSQILTRDGYASADIGVWGAVSFWRSLMPLDLIDEFRLDVHPYVAGEGTRLFNDDVPKSYRLDLVSSTAFSNGTVGLQYRRHR
jgi:dihydrofolate reductase